MATNHSPLSRRGFLAALGSLAASSVFPGTPLAESLIGRETTDGVPLFASAFKLENGDYGVGIVDDLGQILARISLPGRGHGIAVSPDGTRLVAFARRPGTFAVVVRPFDEAEPQVLTADPGRHYYGHGCFSADGRLLYAVENDFDKARGVVGVYDMSGREIRKLGELETNGIGPHDLLLAPDGKTLIVANGGIKTHPDRAREKLNLDTMTPSVAFLDRETGDLLAEHRLSKDLHQLSLRHMALDGQGRAWVGGQFEGPDTETPPLVGIFSRDEVPVLTDIPGKTASGLQNYIGSVTANASGDVIATSAPRGGQTLFWNAASGDFLGAQTIADGCGVAPIDQGSFLISDGNGALSLVTDPEAPAEILARPPGISWDNHMFALT
ncbi:DUF1513 domain-containing protein [Roseibium sediminicola]|uniref:DUF1513 domain-containing protein n=1 Tax=Roseibium sediminicola TaxID=2933272 RepID=A0ABT0H3U0_9HYPH|nr:DUF1513 domain-containing protein [Roseibium sp. CAU 1639]MCK7616125.1 DUF1513 domain-containing protein [Roseibium sp. CAU 1639]